MPGIFSYFIMDTKTRLQQEIETIASDLKALSRQLYEHPEVAFQEYQSCVLLSKYLGQYGFQVEQGIGEVETAFYARIPEHDAPPKVALLAEYDALPQIGHGCGHNLIAAASVGAGVALSRCIDDIEGSVVVIGTPAEEGGGGKILLLNAGIFDDVNVAMMFHPSSRTVVGNNSLGRIKFTVEFFGKASHASGSPEEGINALDAMIAFFSGIGLLRQQLRSEAKIHGIITHGGDAPNIIPHYTAACMYVRAMDSAYLEEVFAKVKQCAEGAALATRAEVKIMPDPLRYEPRKRSFELERVCLQNMEALGLTVEKPEPGKLGSTDLGNLSQKLPAIHPTIAICGPEIAGHSVEMAEATISPQGQDALIKAAKMLAMTAYDYLASPDIQACITQEFEQTQN
jgi:amidohydrolase